MSRSDLNIGRWLEAHSDRSANLTTFPGHSVLADVAGDRDFRLVLADLNIEQEKRSRLKVYKGTSLTSDQVLPELPSAVISFYSDNLEPKLPTIGVSCGSDLLLYKNNKPFFKFTIPNSPILSLEENVWKDLYEPENDRTKLIENLKRIPYSQLTSRSQQLLGLSLRKIDEYIDAFIDKPLIKTSPITCMGILSKNNPDYFSVSCPILGTECGNIYVLDPLNFSILHQANVSASNTTPAAIIRTCGSYDIEFRILIACRENCITVIRRNWLEGKLVVKLTEEVVDFLIIPGDTFIIVATNNKTLHCYTKRGQRLWSTQVINPITCLCLVPLKHLSTHLIGVGMKGGGVHFYHNRQCVDFTNVSDSPSTLIFGQLGQEEHVLVIITQAGTINFKILKRTADFNLNARDNKVTMPITQSKPLPLPKRSKLFLEQSMRERQNALDMHQHFQQDLIQLRLTTARALVQNISDQSGIGNEQEQVKLSAQVLGLGPKFTLILTLENMNSDKPIVDFSLIFHTNPIIYTLSIYFTQLPLIPPGLSFKIDTKVTEIINPNQSVEEGERQGLISPPNQVIRVFVIRKGQAQPVLAATVNMPPTEMSTII